MGVARARRPGAAGRGVILLEALVAILLFALGVLAMAALQAAMLRQASQAGLRTQAAFLANQLLGQMWLDRDRLASYVIAGDACQAPAFAPCARWRQAVAQALPQGQAEVSVAGDAVGIALSWRMPGEAPARFEIDTRINP